MRQEATINIVKRGNAVNINETRNSYFGYDVSPNENLFKQFLESINPIDTAEWKQASCFRKTMICLKAPMNFLLLLFIPIVSYEADRHGWSKLLNCIQLVVLPLTTTFIMCKWVQAKFFSCRKKVHFLFKFHFLKCMECQSVVIL